MSNIILQCKDGGDFKPHPEGIHPAVCVDVVDLGLIQSTFADEKTGKPKMQHKVEIVWQSEQQMSDGKPYLVKKRYTLSLNEKATLRHDLESWRGKPFTDNEAQGFDLEKLLGANCNINVVHKAGSRGGTFANVVSIMPLSRSQQRISLNGYVRQCERTAADVEDAPYDSPDIAPNDDDIPFSWVIALLLPASLAARALFGVFA